MRDSYTHIYIYIYIHICLYTYIYILALSLLGGGATLTFIISPQMPHNRNLDQVGFLAAVRAQPRCHMSHCRRVRFVTQQTCLLRHTTDMPAVSHSRYVCCLTPQTCLLYRDPADNVCCVAGQTLSGPTRRTLDSATRTLDAIEGGREEGGPQY